jgi:hypothetical protein
VYETMMEAAQRHEVAEFRLPAMGPVMHVVAIDVFLVGAAREYAALVP